MGLIFVGDDANPPSPDRRYFLELLYVPEGIVGAPEVGTVWEISYRDVFYIEVPTYRWWEDGPGPNGEPHGYLFSFTITPTVPEPTGFTGVLCGAALIAARRRG